MSYESAVSKTNAAAAAQGTVITPEAMVDQLRALRQQIPEYVQLPPVEARSIQTVASVHPEFAQAAINAIGASPTVQSVVVSTPEELQLDAETAARWSKVEDELSAMLRGLSAANLVRRNRVGKASLLVYSLSKSLVRSPEHADLLPHLAIMRKTNRFGRSRKSSQPQAPAPTPKPTPSPAPSPAGNPTPASHV